MVSGHVQVHGVDLLPHLRRNGFAHGTRVLARGAQTGKDGIGILRVEGEKVDHVVLGGLAVAFAERLGIAAGIDQGLPLLRGIQRQIELQIEIDADVTRDVFRALDVARHPVDGVGNAAEERAVFLLIY